MTQRDQKLLVILGSVAAGFGLVAFLFYQWFWAPLQAYNATIVKMEAENELLDQEWQRFEEGKRRLALAKLKSLPAKPDQATTEYVSYLENTIKDAGLQLVYLTPSGAAKVKPPAAVPEIKDARHQIVTFTVRALGEEAGLVAAFERMKKTPYEHRVKNWAVERAETGYEASASKRLKIEMVIEVLLVADNTNKMGLHPGVNPAFYLYNHIAARYGAAPAGWGLWASTIAVVASSNAEARRRAGPAGMSTAWEMPTRDYDDIARRNIFVGMMPVIKTAPRVKKEIVKVEPPIPEPDEDALAYVKLVQTSPSQKEAYIFNRLYGRHEKLIAKPRSGYDIFTIREEDGPYVFVRAKILLVESREIYFQVHDQVYRLGFGETMRQSLEHKVSVEDLFDLDLHKLYDKEFAKENGSEPKKSNTKKKGSKGR